MNGQTHISRRTILKGLGTAMALPLLDCMWPASSFAGEAAGATPNRMAFVYVPNGIHMAAWTPASEGARFELPSILEPLKPFQNDLLVLTGLAQDKARANGDGPGDHARSAATFLTGAQARKTNGADIRVGVSVDQLAAQKYGQQTKFSSLELGCEQGAQAGNCDSGYSCAYSSNISWRTESTPVAKEINPRQVFDRLFSNSSSDESRKSAALRERHHRSILDFVQEEARQLQASLGATDRRKMEEYLTSVRELEVRIGRSEQDEKQDLPKLARPSGIPKDYGEHIRIMSDLLVLAFQGDLSRIATFLFANEGSTKSYSFIGVPEGHHDVSHHGGNKDKQEKIRQINRFHVTQFAYLLDRLKAVPEGDGTLLDHVMIVYGSGISDGNRHNHNDLPVLLAGHGCGTLKTGRHVKYEKDTPLNNLYLSMLDRIGAPTGSLGDSTGRLTDLDV